MLCLENVVINLYRGFVIITWVGMQIVKKAIVRKMKVNNRLYGRIHIVVPGYLVGKEVVVVVWTEPSLEDTKPKRKGIKLDNVGIEEIEL